MREAWRYSQVVRQGSAKPLCPGSNPGGASKKKHFLFGKCFFLCPQGHNSDFCSVALVCRSEAKFVGNYRNFKYNNIQLKVSEGELNGE